MTDQPLLRNVAIGYVANLPTSDPNCFEMRELPQPQLEPRDVLVEVEAVSVNPVDTKQRQSAAANGFRVLGFDAAGTVREVGSAVSLFTPGEEVFYAGSIIRPGSNQRFQAVDERIVGRKPATLSFADAASLPLTALTAWESLFDKLRLNSKSRGSLLVIGATGGVGSVMLQIAEAVLPNVTVIATASDAEKTQWVTELGAEHAVNHREDLVAQLASIVPDGVDWLFTAHSSGMIPSYAQIMKPFGQIVAVEGNAEGFTALKAKSITWHWELMFTRSTFQTADMIEQHCILNRIADLVDEGKIRPTTNFMLSPISAETLRQAHEQVESGTTVGKVVLHGWE